jgi:cbb3-type cytochrome oxidase subunit 1
MANEFNETYNDQIVRLFPLAAAGWGIVGMSVGVYAAAELAWPFWNFDVPFLTFSRIRPDHTFGVIFAFGGSAAALLLAALEAFGVGTAPAMIAIAGDPRADTEGAADARTSP